MVRRCQAICHGDAENFERRGSDNSWQQRRRNNLTLPFPVDENDLIRFLPVERQVVGPCPRLYVVYFGGPRVDVAGRDDKVGIICEFAELVTLGYRLQVACISQ